jgi:hypothetical protein
MRKKNFMMRELIIMNFFLLSLNFFLIHLEDERCFCCCICRKMNTLLCMHAYLDNLDLNWKHLSVFIIKQPVTQSVSLSYKTAHNSYELIFLNIIIICSSIFHSTLNVALLNCQLNKSISARWKIKIIIVRH